MSTYIELDVELIIVNKEEITKQNDTFTITLSDEKVSEANVSIMKS